MSHSARFLEKWKARRRSAPGRVEVIPDVESRELGKRRDILVYLPSSYDRTEKPYPVIYMHDGQNLFDPASSFAGEWGVDTALARRRGRVVRRWDWARMPNRPDPGVLTLSTRIGGGT
jgi:hypothetical protein